MHRLLWAAAFIAAAPAYAAHPLITEDTGTQGKGRQQLEVFGEDGRTRGAHEALDQQTTVFSYGLSESSDLQASLPWQGDGASRGAGDAALDLKWRFYESGAFSLGVKPGITLPTGDDGKGLGAGRAGWGTLLIVSYEPGRLAVHAHAGYKRNRNTLGARESLTHYSVAAVLHIPGNVRLVADAARDTDPDPAVAGAQRSLVLGAIWSVSRDFDLDAGVKTGGGSSPLDRALLLGATARW
jgi:hypothetical protein